MDEEPQPDALRLVKQVLSQTADSDRGALLAWLKELREIRDQPTTKLLKTQAALRASAKGQVVVALAKSIAVEVSRSTASSKQMLWSDRSWAGRLGLAGVAFGTVAFGGEVAGAAALGSAVGLPLWLVLGAGGSFLDAMIDELERGHHVD